ncbi:MAG: hypothetical protein ABIJ46_01075 [bacterium]
MLQQPGGLAKLAPWKTKRQEDYIRTLSLKVPTTSGRFGDVQGLICAVSDTRTGDILAANIEETFADAVEQTLNTLPINATLEKTFETAIHRVNTMLSRLLGDGGLSVAPGDVKGAIVAQRGQDVAAAVWGRPSLLLFRRATVGGPKVFDVIENDSSVPVPQPMPGMVGFTNLISGQIGPHDRMLISNRDLLDLLGKMEMLEIMSAGRTDLVTTMLRDALLGRHESLDLAILLLDGATTNDSPLPAGATSRVVRRTEEPAGALRNRTNMPEPSLLRTEEPRELLPRLLDMSRTALTWTKQAVTIAAKYGAIAFRWSKDTAVILVQSSRTLLSALAKKGAERIKQNATKPTAERADRADEDGETNVLHLTEDDLAGTDGPNIIPPPSGGGRLGPAFDAWRSLDRRSRNLLLAAVGLTLVVIVSLTGLFWRRSSDQTTAGFDKQVAAIRQQIDSAEASLIYRDEDRARRLLDEAMAAIAGLPDRPEDRAQTKQELSEEIRLRFSDLRRAVQLDAPEVIASISSDGQPVELRLLTTETNGRLWTAAADGRIFLVSTDGSAELLHTPNPSKAPTFLLPKGNGTLVGYDDGQLVSVSTGGKVAELPLSIGDYETGIGAAAVYGSRMYLLDPGHNRILRLAATGNGYGSPEIYVKDGTDLSKSVSLTIDGSVYVLSSDGKIVRLLQGKGTDFNTDPTDPPLSSPRLIRSSSDRDDLYVLDGGRVVRFDKTGGRLIRQYESADLESAGDFLAVQSERHLLITNGNRLLRFTWPEEN